MFKNTLFLKIILVFTLPALGMMYFSTVLVYEKIQNLSSINNIQKNIHYLYHTKNLIDAIEKERHNALLFILKGLETKELNSAIKHTNTKYQLFLDKNTNIEHTSNNQLIDIKTLQENFYTLTLLREHIQASQTDAWSVLKAYKQFNNLLISTLNTINPIDFSTSFNTKLHYLSDLITIKENISLEYLSIKTILQEQNISATVQNDLIQNQTIQDIHLKKFLLNASIKEINKYSQEVSLSLLNKIENLRQNINKGNFSKAQSLHTLNEKNIALQNIYTFVYVQLENMGNKIKKQANVDQFLSLSFLFISFVTLISLLFVLKNIIFNEQKSYNKLNKQQEVYKLLHATNKFLLTSSDEKKLYKEICKLISINKSMSFGFIYKINQNSQKLIAHEGVLKKIITEKLKQNRQSLITQAIDEDRNVILDSFDKENISILSEHSKEHALCSAGAFPIKCFDKTVAVMVLYSNEYDFFDNEIEILFNTMITDMRHSLEKLHYEKARIQHEHELKIASYAFESNEPMIITDQTAHIIKVNQTFCKVMGYKKEEIIGRNPNMFKSSHHDKKFYDQLWDKLHKNGTWSGEIFNTMKNKQNVPMRSTITAIKNAKGIVTHYLAQYIDISEQIDRQKILEYQATHDNLTGLPNRLLLLDRLERALVKTQRHQIIGGLIFIDLDNFKEVNDTMGHEIGDKLLILVAKKINETIRKEDTIARMGGDEFIVLADNIGSTMQEAHKNMQSLAQKIKLALNSIIEINGHKNISTPSIGVTVFKDATLNINDIIKQADTAMYEAKKQGKNSIAFFEDCTNN